MKNKGMWWGIGAVVLIVVLLIIGQSRNAPLSETQEPQVLTNAVFINNEGVIVPATFMDSSVTFTFNGEEITLEQAVAASGARYTNTDESLVLWNKGDMVTIYKNDAVIFEGSEVQEGTPVAPPKGAPQGKLPPGSLPAAPAESLLGTWVWKETLMNDDSVRTPKKSDAFTVKFSEKGQMGGTTDCNGFFGSYKVGSDRVLSIGPIGSTLMFCEGSQENEFRKDLENSTSYLITPEGNLVLLLKYDSGSVIFTKK